MSGSDIVAILQGAVVTVTLSLIGILIGMPIGLALAVLRWADVPVLARMVAVYVSILRATPLVTLLLLLFFALPNIGIAIGPISAAILGLVMNTAAFNCEVWRAALMNFPKDQYEAAQSIGNALRLKKDYHLVILGSTVMPGVPSSMVPTSFSMRIRAAFVRVAARIAFMAPITRAWQAISLPFSPCISASTSDPDPIRSPSGTLVHHFHVSV